MISKQTFIKTIDYVKHIIDIERSLNNGLKHSMVFVDSEIYIETGPITDLLAESIGLKKNKFGTDLDYWLYECDFGRDYKKGDITNTNLKHTHKYYKPKLDTVEELYDYLVFIAKYEEK